MWFYCRKFVKQQNSWSCPSWFISCPIWSRITRSWVRKHRSIIQQWVWDFIRHLIRSVAYPPFSVRSKELGTLLHKGRNVRGHHIWVGRCSNEGPSSDPYWTFRGDASHAEWRLPGGARQYRKNVDNFWMRKGSSNPTPHSFRSSFPEWLSTHFTNSYASSTPMRYRQLLRKSA